MRHLVTGICWSGSALRWIWFCSDSTRFGSVFTSVLVPSAVGVKCYQVKLLLISRFDSSCRSLFTWVLSGDPVQFFPAVGGSVSAGFTPGTGLCRPDRTRVRMTSSLWPLTLYLGVKEGCSRVGVTLQTRPQVGDVDPRVCSGPLIFTELSGGKDWTTSCKAEPLKWPHVVLSPSVQFSPKGFWDQEITSLFGHKEQLHRGRSHQTDHEYKYF